MGMVASDMTRPEKSAGGFFVSQFGWREPYAHIPLKRRPTVRLASLAAATRSYSDRDPDSTGRRCSAQYGDRVRVRSVGYQFEVSMSADIIQIRDHQSRRQRDQAEAALRGQTLEQQAIEIMNVALLGGPTMLGMEPVIHIEIPFAGQGIDGMWTDTSPSEMNPDKPA